MVQVEILTMNKFTYLKKEAVRSTETSETPKYTRRCNNQNHDTNLNKTAVNTYEFLTFMYFTKHFFVFILIV